MAKRKVFEQPRIKFDDVHGYLQELFKGDVHSKRVLSLANATHGVMTSGSLVIHAIGKGLSQAKGLLTKHAIKQVDRLMSNKGIDVWQAFAYRCPPWKGEARGG